MSSGSCSRTVQGNHVYITLRSSPLAVLARYTVQKPELVCLFRSFDGATVGGWRMEKRDRIRRLAEANYPQRWGNIHPLQPRPSAGRHPVWVQTTISRNIMSGHVAYEVSRQCRPCARVQKRTGSLQRYRRARSVCLVVCLGFATVAHSALGAQFIRVTCTPLQRDLAPTSPSCPLLTSDKTRNLTPCRHRSLRAYFVPRCLDTVLMLNLDTQSLAGHLQSYPRGWTMA